MALNKKVGKKNLGCFPKGNIPWNKNKKGLQVAWNKNIPLSEATKRKISKAKKGKKHSEKSRKIHNRMVKCKICKKEFWIKLSRLKSGRGKYCSRKCFGIGRSKFFKHTPETIQKMKGKVPWNKKDKIKKTCFYCHRMFEAYPYEKDRAKFCCRSCNAKYQNRNGGFFKGKFHSENTKNKLRQYTGSLASNWQNGISFEPYSIEFNNQLKEQIRKRDHYRCQQCFKHQDELYYPNGQKYSLFIHHIDYNKQNCNSNNLISLCANCHCQTNFKRKDWTNYFNTKLIQQYGTNL